MTLPAGLASISGAMDDSPHARAAIDMAHRLRRAETLSQLAEHDADHLSDQAAIDRQPPWRSKAPTAPRTHGLSCFGRVALRW